LRVSTRRGLSNRTTTKLGSTPGQVVEAASYSTAAAYLPDHYRKSHGSLPTSILPSRPLCLNVYASNVCDPTIPKVRNILPGTTAATTPFSLGCSLAYSQLMHDERHHPRAEPGFPSNHPNLTTKEPRSYSDGRVGTGRTNFGQQQASVTGLEVSTLSGFTGVSSPPPMARPGLQAKRKAYLCTSVVGHMGFLDPFSVSLIGLELRVRGCMCIHTYSQTLVLAALCGPSLTPSKNKEERAPLAA